MSGRQWIRRRRAGPRGGKRVAEGMRCAYVRKRRVNEAPAIGRRRVVDVQRNHAKGVRDAWLSERHVQLGLRADREEHAVTPIRRARRPQREHGASAQRGP